MISSLRLHNFKAAQDLTLRFGGLTVLAGLNGSGKSSVLQSLAMLKQSYLAPNPTELRLRGPLVQLGTYTDVRTEGGDDDAITIEVAEGGSVFRWDAIDGGNDYLLRFETKPSEVPEFLKDRNFQLLPADRIVPRNTFSRSDLDSDCGFLGPRGEFVVEFLLSDIARKHIVSENRICPRNGYGITDDLLEKAAPTSLLVDQVSGWLQQLSPGVRVDVEELIGTDEVALRYDYVGRTGFSESNKKIRPANVGFGLTYSLPLVVASLFASRGSLLLLENPEAHLHPQGQAALGELMVRAAADGVQIVVETHSDHVLNGIRLAVKRRLTTADNIVIHYFTRSINSGFISSQSPAIQNDGRLSNWPRGFFDQWDLAVDALLEE